MSIAEQTATTTVSQADDWKYAQVFSLGQRVSLAELRPGDNLNEPDSWATESVDVGAVGTVQYVNPNGPPEYFVRFAYGPVTVRGWYYASQLRPEATGTPGDGPDTAPHVRGSDASKAAARAISTATLRGNREKLLRVILDPANTWRRGVPISAGFTDNELIRYMVDRHFWSPNAPRARRIDLVRGGWVEDSGETRDGCTVWKPTEKAFAWWQAQEGGGGAAFVG